LKSSTSKEEVFESIKTRKILKEVRSSLLRKLIKDEPKLKEIIESREPFEKQRSFMIFAKLKVQNESTQDSRPR